MSLGHILLIAIGILIIFGVAQRILDRMGMSDRLALIVVAAIFIGGYIPDIPLGANTSINIGGAIIPAILCIYLFVKAGTAKERVRAIVATIVSAGVVLLLDRFLPSEPESMWIDPMYLYGVLAGIVAYLLGRSRRSAFIGGVMGILVADLGQGLLSRYQGVDAAINLGGGGAFDATLISGIIAVILADLIGEIREKMQGGTAKQGLEYNNGSFQRKHRKEAVHDGEANRISDVTGGDGRSNT